MWMLGSVLPVMAYGTGTPDIKNVTHRDTVQQGIPDIKNVMHRDAV